MNNSLRSQAAYANNSKSVVVGYLLWLFLGAFGVHRFYAGKTKSGIAQLILLCTVVGVVVLIPWLLADLFLIPGMIREHNSNLLSMIHGASEETSRPVENRTPTKSLTEADRKREAMLEELRSIGYKKERRDTSHLYR